MIQQQVQTSSPEMTKIMAEVTRRCMKEKIEVFSEAAN